MAKLSVIVPLLKGNPYLQDCLDSLLKDSFFKDLELLVVISSLVEERCDPLLKTYSQEYERLKVLDFLSLTYEQAIEKALEEARGDYISFVASSDQVARNYFDRLLACAQEANISMVVCNVYRYHASPQGLPQALQAVPSLSVNYRSPDNVYYLYHLASLLLTHMPCHYAGVYKTSLLKENSISLGKASRFLAPFLHHCLVCAEEVYLLEEELYYARFEEYEKQLSFLDSFKAYLENAQRMREQFARTKAINYALLKQDLYAAQLSWSYKYIMSYWGKKDISQALCGLKESYEQTLKDGFLKINIAADQREFYNLLQAGKLTPKRMDLLIRSAKIKRIFISLAHEALLPLLAPFVIIFRLFYVAAKALLIRRIS